MGRGGAGLVMSSPGGLVSALRVRGVVEVLESRFDCAWPMLLL